MKRFWTVSQRSMLAASGVTIVAMLCLLASAGVAQASTTTQKSPPTGPNVQSWSLSAVGANPGEPGSRPNLSYALAPGATIEDAVTIWNYSDQQMNFEVYAADAFNTGTGGFNVLSGDKTSKDVASWVKLEQNNITAVAHSATTIPFTLTIPADARPGDHSAGIIASSKTPSDQGGRQVILDRRVGSRLYVRVAGDIRPSLSVDNVSSSYHPKLNPLKGTLDVTYTVRNSGNVRLGAKTLISVSDLFGSVAKRKGKPLPELLPGNSVTFTEKFDNVAATLRVKSAVAVKPSAVSGSDLKDPNGLVPVSQSSTTWAIPWLLVLVLAVLAVVILLNRRRRSRAAGSGPVPGAAPGGPGPGGSPAGHPPAGPPQIPVGPRS